MEQVLAQSRHGHHAKGTRHSCLCIGQVDARQPREVQQSVKDRMQAMHAARVTDKDTESLSMHLEAMYKAVTEDHILC